MLAALTLGWAMMVADGPPRAGSAAIEQTQEQERERERAAYQALAAKAGRDADANVKLALWCEAHGLAAERLKHLALATLINPDHAMARGLLGMVRHDGKWRYPADLAREAREDPARKATLQEYLNRRVKTKGTPDDHWNLAVWCEENGLKPQAIAHYHQVLRLDPHREAAWKRLGYRKMGNHWVDPVQLTAARAEAELQKQSDKRWRPLLESYRGALRGKSADKKAVAEEALRQIVDPRAVPSLLTVFLDREPRLPNVAVRVLGQIDSGDSSRALALLSVFSDAPEVRGRSADILKRRDPREYAGLLISLMRDPIKYRANPVGGPGIPGTLLVEGDKANVQRQYTPPLPPLVGGWSASPFSTINTFDPEGYSATIRTAPGLSGFGGSGYVLPDGSYALFGYDGLGSNLNAASQSAHATAAQIAGQIAGNPAAAPQVLSANQGKLSNPGRDFYLNLINQSMYITGAMAAFGQEGPLIPTGRAAMETQRAAIAAQQQLEGDVRALDTYNSGVNALNQRIADVLNQVTQESIPAERKAWMTWFTDQIGFNLRTSNEMPRPTVVEEVPLDYQLPPLAGINLVENRYVRLSCFGAGTLVQTLNGARPIEDLAIGDPVLSQDTRTGALDFHPILVVHRNPPSKTLRITLAGETIVSSEFHRFWKAGQGWVMARELRAGDPIRTLHGTVPVTSISKGEVTRVFNLDVAFAADFFVGQGSALVHDNTLPDLWHMPFDALEPPGGGESRK